LIPRDIAAYERRTRTRDNLFAKQQSDKKYIAMQRTTVGCALPIPPYISKSLGELRALDSKYQENRKFSYLPWLINTLINLFKIIECKLSTKYSEKYMSCSIKRAKCKLRTSRWTRSPNPTHFLNHQTPSVPACALLTAAFSSRLHSLGWCTNSKHG